MDIWTYSDIILEILIIIDTHDGDMMYDMTEGLMK